MKNLLILLAITFITIFSSCKKCIMCKTNSTYVSKNNNTIPGYPKKQYDQGELCGDEIEDYKTEVDTSYDNGVVIRIDTTVCTKKPRRFLWDNNNKQ